MAVSHVCITCDTCRVLGAYPDVAVPCGRRSKKVSRVLLRDILTRREDGAAIIDNLGVPGEQADTGDALLTKEMFWFLSSFLLLPLFYINTRGNT